MGFSIATVFDDTGGDRFGENDQDVRVIWDFESAQDMLKPEI